MTITKRNKKKTIEDLLAIGWERNKLSAMSNETLFALAEHEKDAIDNMRALVRKQIESREARDKRVSYATRQNAMYQSWRARLKPLHKITANPPSEIRTMDREYYVKRFKETGDRRFADLANLPVNNNRQLV